MALSGEPEKPAKAKPKKTAKHTPEEIATKAVLLDYFVTRFERVKGCRPKSIDAADHAAAFKLDRTYGIESFEIIDRAFQDSFVVEKNATLRFIASKADTFRGKTTVAPKSNGRPVKNPIQDQGAEPAYESVVQKGGPR